MVETLTRRRFLGRISTLLIAAAGAVISVPILAYLISPLFRFQIAWRDLGPVERFEIGKTVEVNFEEPSPLPWAGTLATTAAWIRRVDETRFLAFAVTCTHLGCPVSWQDGARLFFCPCHGGAYYADGRVAAGPPPKPLFQYQTRVQNGHVQLLTRPLPIG
ncbi:ubiquinol-cytochrome c reductase iron-sulfur subunit [Nitrolancea hollandica]|uniref:Ubiquinol-cytochrome c reductase, iron-sulfur subunit n=1 Tax=Nitrolancea hollandica Lb TaxID=1129897 RepID=I4ENF2_9BACT|nr:ubiquinol-cytochrome c reductase iron-sulfur subunit [Nitrolancea hollandica]CCF86215.1 Ubiquinol-cytochrome c reductase, iron-sulfur subunit [Nitrolancea hollandica Lb]